MSDVDEKQYDTWNSRKKDLHRFGREPHIQNGEIWWGAVGENIGVEINGKGMHFMRPIFVIRKLSRFGFIGIPLTSQPHEGSWYVKFRFQGKDEYAVLAQIRNFSVRRLYRRMGRADDSDVRRIREGLDKFFQG